MLNTSEPDIRSFIRNCLMEIDRVRNDAECPPKVRQKWVGRTSKLKIANVVRAWMARRLDSTPAAVRDRLARR
jgi:hypothetical protein